MPDSDLHAITQGLIKLAWNAEHLRTIKRRVSTLITGLGSTRRALKHLLSAEEARVLDEAQSVLERWQPRAERALRRKEQIEAERKRQLEEERMQRQMALAANFLDGLTVEKVLEKCEALDAFLGGFGSLAKLVKWVRHPEAFPQYGDPLETLKRRVGMALDEELPTVCSPWRFNENMEAFEKFLPQWQQKKRREISINENTKACRLLLQNNDSNRDGSG